MSLVATKIPSGWPEREKRSPRAIRLATNTGPEQPLQVSASPQITEWLQSLRSDINDLTNLKSGWDGTGSHQVNVRRIWKLLRILLRLDATAAPKPQLVPLPSGGVQAEWHHFKQTIEVGVTSDGEIFAFATDKNGDDIVELEDNWFIPRDKLVALRHSLSSLTNARRHDPNA
jgi:hypothetical protein